MTSDVPSGTLLHDQLPIAFQSVLDNPVQTPVTHVPPTLITPVAVVPKRVGSWLIAVEAVDPHDPGACPILLKYNESAVWVKVPRFAEAAPGNPVSIIFKSLFMAVAARNVFTPVPESLRL